MGYLVSLYYTFSMYVTDDIPPVHHQPTPCRYRQFHMKAPLSCISTVRHLVASHDLTILASSQGCMTVSIDSCTALAR